MGKELGSWASLFEPLSSPWPRRTLVVWGGVRHSVILAFYLQTQFSQ